MILVVNICKERLHHYEFVKPIEDILKKKEIKFFTKHYKEIKEGHIKNADKIIICGTSLKDDGFIRDINYFRWIENFKKPILGICGGMQIISLIFELKRQVEKLEVKNNLNHVIKQKTEIGFYKENFVKNFLGLKGEQEVYHLHNNYVSLPKDFVKYTNSKLPQAIKHKTKPIYGVLFHLEVRNEEMILGFCK